MLLVLIVTRTSYLMDVKAMLARRQGLDLWRPAQVADTKGQRQEPDALLLSSKRRPAINPQAGDVRLVGR